MFLHSVVSFGLVCSCVCQSWQEWSVTPTDHTSTSRSCCSDNSMVYLWRTSWPLTFGANWNGRSCPTTTSRPCQWSCVSTEGNPYLGSPVAVSWLLMGTFFENQLVQICPNDSKRNNISIHPNILWSHSVGHWKEDVYFISFCSILFGDVSTVHVFGRCCCFWGHAHKNSGGQLSSFLRTIYWGPLWTDMVMTREMNMPPQALGRAQPMSDANQSLLQNPFYLVREAVLWTQWSSHMFTSVYVCSELDWIG